MSLERLLTVLCLYGVLAGLYWSRARKPATPLWTLTVIANVVTLVYVAGCWSV